MNRIRQAQAEGRPSFGGWSVLPGSLPAELMGRAGFDWVIIDTQHGGVVPGDLIPMIQALELGGTAPVVRVPWMDPPTIMRVLDFGARGVIVPMVETAADARAAAAAMRYPPRGMRSFGPTRAAYGSPADANDDVVLLPMIETVLGLENVEEIASTPGVDGLFIGPVDLGLSMGLPLDWTGSSPGVLDAVDRVVAACARTGRFAGTVSSSADHALDLLRRGVSFITLGADVGYLMAGVARDSAVLATLRAADSSPPVAANRGEE
jgi:4-hydroxy-2-oxoheptanedioate aldolase